MLLMVEKRIRGGIFRTIDWYAKANNECTKDYDKNKESPYLKYLGVNKFCAWAMSQKLPVNDLDCLKILFNLMKIS